VAVELKMETVGILDQVTQDNIPVDFVKDNGDQLIPGNIMVV
jgi:hypothetical protein